jgi:hypothetical protein
MAPELRRRALDLVENGLWAGPVELVGVTFAALAIEHAASRRLENPQMLTSSIHADRRALALVLNRPFTGG